MSNSNYECEKCLYFVDGNMGRCLSPPCVLGCRTPMELVIAFMYYNLKSAWRKRIHIEKGEDSAFVSVAADRFKPFGGPVKSDIWHIPGCSNLGRNLGSHSIFAV